MEANISKGNAAIAEAEAALGRTSIFGFGQKRKHEDAAEAYNRAGNFFKLGNDFKKAAVAYKKSAEQFSLTGEERTEIGNAVVEAAGCYKRAGDIVKSIEMFERAITMFNDKGRIGQSARYAKEVAEMVENDGNKELAVEKYRIAADLFEMDNKKSNSSQCKQKIASLLIDLSDTDPSHLGVAAEIFEATGKEAMTAKLTSFSAKNHFFMALLVLLAQGDLVKVGNKMDQYKGDDHTFGSTREADFIAKLAAAIEQYDLNGYEVACADFDRITPLDSPKIKLLLLAKQPIIDAVGGVGGTDGEVDLS